MSDTQVISRTVTGKTLYFQIERGSLIYNGTSFVALAIADWASYDNTMPETPAGSGRYIGAFPSLAADYYTCSIYMQRDATPDPSDPSFGTFSSYWDGTQFLPSGPSNLSSDAWDSIIIEEATDTTPQINGRQALKLVLNGAPAGLITGVDSPSPISVFNPDGSKLRMLIQADPNGNRNNVQFFDIDS